MNTTQNTNKDLGTMNGWRANSENYEIVHKCYKNKHKIKSKNLGNCYNEYTCTECNVTWQIDSSG